MSRHTKIDSRYLLASAAIAVAAVMSMATPAFAADEPAVAPPAPQHASTRAPSDREPQPGSHIFKDSNVTKLDTIQVNGYLGAILRPGDAQWADADTSAPELPMVRDQAVTR